MTEQERYDLLAEKAEITAEDLIGAYLRKTDCKTCIAGEWCRARDYQYPCNFAMQDWLRVGSGVG